MHVPQSKSHGRSVTVTRTLRQIRIKVRLYYELHTLLQPSPVPHPATPIATLAAPVSRGSASTLCSVLLGETLNINDNNNLQVNGDAWQES